MDDRLAVCSWSMRVTTLAELIDRLRDVGLSRTQIALDPFRTDPDDWNDAPSRLAYAGVEPISGMFGCVGEDYGTLDAIRRTGGVVPDETWPQTWENVQEMAPIAKSLGLTLVTFHAGFVPEDENDPGFAKVRERLTRIADLFEGLAIEVALETGQETAAALDRFLAALDHPNVGVNFDPANMILYDKGDPIEALATLMPHLKQCHIKDAVRTTEPGAWGTEVPVGEGEVDWTAFLRTLRDAAFTGNLAIEREAGEERVGDIRKAVAQIRKTSEEIGT